MGLKVLKPAIEQSGNAVPTNPSLAHIFIMLIFGFNSAVGTTLYASSWYYIIPAVSWIDMAILINFFLIITNRRNQLVLATTKIEKKQAYLILLFVALLIFSTSINAFRFETEIKDLFPALKFVYFIALIHVIKHYSDRFGIPILTTGFFLGVAAVAWQSYRQAQVYIIGETIVLWDPNVTGALLGLGVFFATLSILYKTNIIISLLATTGFCTLSMLTWSKGSWLMCASGAVVTCLLLLNHSKKQAVEKQVNKKLYLAIAALFFGTSIFLASSNFELIKLIIERKLSSTFHINSFGVRLNLIIASLHAGFNNPLIGLGYRNFYYVEQYVSHLHLLDRNQLESWNAHNAFFQILAVAGVPAFFVFLRQFATPFLVLQDILSKHQLLKGSRRIAFLLLVFIWVLYGSIQLQLLAQPPFWFFCGIIFSLHQSVIAKNAGW